MRVILACFWVQNNIRRVELGQTVYDDVVKGSSKTYILDLPPTSNNGSISVKFLMYIGKCEVKITADGKSSPKAIDANFTDSMIHFTITNELRTELGIK